MIASVDPRSGGPVEGIRQTSRFLAPLGIREEVATLDTPGQPFLDAFPLPVVALGEPGWRRAFSPSFAYSPRLALWMQGNARRFGAVIIHGLWSYNTLGGGRGARAAGVPYVVYSHGMLDPWFKRTYPLKHAKKWVFWQLYLRRVLKEAAAVLFTTEEERLLARQTFSDHAYIERVVRFGTGDPSGDPAAQMAAFRSSAPALGDRSYLLFLGRINPKKGCDLLVRAFAEIAGAFPEVDLVIAGPDEVGWQARLQEEAAAAGVAQRIHWPGMLGGDVKWGAFRAADAFVLPSHQENFGIVVAEALACSTPVLISDKVNIWREVEAGEGGLVGSDDLAGTTKVLRAFLGLSPAERATMREAARRTFADKFDVRAAAADLVAVLKGVSSGRAAGA